jgi:Flp pilus assembly pilin Flp
MGRSAKQAWWRDSRGAGFVEYLVLAGAVALLAFGGYRLWASRVEHKAEAQAQTVRSLASPGGGAEPGGEAPAANAGPANDPAETAARGAEVESVAAFDNSNATETPGMSTSVIVMFVLGLLLVGGVVIATVARPRHAAADAESANTSQ